MWTNPSTWRRRLAVIAMGAVLAIGITNTASAGGASHAYAVIADLDGTTIGWALFIEDARGRLHVGVLARGLTPGLHGIHIHNTGECVPPFSTAGSHHNPPPGATHGSHAGDLPNLMVNRAGWGHLHARTDRATLTPGPTSIFDGNGSALVIHAAPDDLVTDPTGNSGARIACGVIRRG